MRPLAILASIAVLGLSGCVTPPSDAMHAIFAAAEAAPDVVPGVYVIQIQGTGRRDGRLYLNSEADYRDQRNLTIAISPSAFAGLEARFGPAPETRLTGRRIAVTGSAMRVRIDFTGNGQPTGKYYFQTHVVVNDADQIALR
ncbi:hypothetical protein [Brevundimonas sp. NIBR11]|uniref:hypothetical protein n=1 Tax=Brevundimonas sp. NIBR11 TaxID=3015999 RepID=UPI0022F00CD7|nr:hypothetical protein [Brevundimonas sp. NIBR11]WGM32476.1 hypothetical protein KKHFBJBL_02728 [Brevundimonas sp. NIBR11]